MTGDDLDFVVLHATTITKRTQKIEQIVSEPKIIKFKPKSRKCLFASESRSQYFDVSGLADRNVILICLIGFASQVYTVNLCKIDCRIKQALSICHCIPFFYVIPMKKEKVCDIKGMICLAENRNSWYNTTTCDCPSLCETTIMTKMTTKEVMSLVFKLEQCQFKFIEILQQDLSFDRMLTVDMVFPKIRIKRSVVFDFDDLIGNLLL